MYHNENDNEMCEINQPNKDTDRSAGDIQHTYTGSTPVTEEKWKDFMEESINQAAINMVLANKHKNKMQPIPEID